MTETRGENVLENKNILIQEKGPYAVFFYL